MLRNRKENLEPKLVGVNRVADPIKMKLGSFQSLENFVQAHRYKIKKKRGPEPLVSCSQGEPEPPVGCSDATPRGQQVLAEQVRFYNVHSGGSSRTSWGYISPEEEVYTAVANGACGGGNANYSTCVEINHFFGAGLPFDNPALVPPPSSFEFTSPIIGVSDVPIYANVTHAAGGNGVYYPLTNTSIVLDVVFTNSFGYDQFAKRGNDFYAFNLNFGDPDRRIGRFDASTGAGIFSAPTTGFGFDLTLETVTAASATDNYVYTVSFLTSNGVIQTLSRIDRVTLEVLETFDLTTIDAAALYTVNDDLIYLLNNHGGLYYVENFTTLVYVGSFNATVGGFGNLHGFYTNGAFYYGSNGAFSVSPTHIYRVTLPCSDEAPTIASVTTDATVAAGANLAVSWADVLEPLVNDRLYLNPVDGTLFHTLPVFSVVPAGAGASSGTVAFPVPGGTTPGDYVIQYVHDGTNLVATSATFTVT